MHHRDVGDTKTIEDTVTTAQSNLGKTGTKCEIQEVVADKGYHSEQMLDDLQNKQGYRTCIPEPEREGRRSRKNKPKRGEVLFRARPDTKPIFWRRILRATRRLSFAVRHART